MNSPTRHKHPLLTMGAIHSFRCGVWLHSERSQKPEHCTCGAEQQRQKDEKERTALNEVNALRTAQVEAAHNAAIASEPAPPARSASVMMAERSQARQDAIAAAARRQSHFTQLANADSHKTGFHNSRLELSRRSGR